MNVLEPCVLLRGGSPRISLRVQKEGAELVRLHSPPVVENSVVASRPYEKRNSSFENLRVWVYRSRLKTKKGPF